MLIRDWRGGRCRAVVSLQHDLHSDPGRHQSSMARVERFLQTDTPMNPQFTEPSTSYFRRSELECVDVGDGSGVAHAFAHLERAATASARAAPFSVRWYSIRTGVSAMTLRTTMPSASSSL